MTRELRWYEGTLEELRKAGAPSGGVRAACVSSEVLVLVTDARARVHAGGLCRRRLCFHCAAGGSARHSQPVQDRAAQAVMTQVSPCLCLSRCTCTCCAWRDRSEQLDLKSRV